MWIPRPLYEVIPYVYIAAGVALPVAAFFTEGGPRSLLLAGGALGLIAGLVLLMRRRDYRASQTEYDSHSLDN
jgi:hypothetical protein